MHHIDSKHINLDGTSVSPPKVPRKRNLKALKKKIYTRVNKRKQLIDWLTFFRLPNERGLGDTAERFSRISQVRSILDQCGCKREDAIDKLNRDHPYNQNNPDSPTPISVPK